MSYANYQKRWTDSEFPNYLNGIDMSWADSVTIHHTYYPDLGMRPNGITPKHQQYLMEYYRDEKGWSAGPHLFIDDVAICGMSPLTEPGTHARSFNSHSIGIEMLGNYDSDDHQSGRGAWVLKRTARAVASILMDLGLKPNSQSILFHRDDPQTSKTCPGTRIDKGEFIDLVRSFVVTSVEPDPDQHMFLEERVARIEKHLGLTS